MHATSAGAIATLSLASSPKVPADLQAQVHSMSAVGEQYVDLQPRVHTGPYLRDGSESCCRTRPFLVRRTTDEPSECADRIASPKDKLNALLDELFKGFNGTRYDLGSLFDSLIKSRRRP